MIKISGFVDEVSFDLDVQIATMKKLGQKYLCPRRINGKNISKYTCEEFMRDIWPKLSDAGIKMSSLGSPIGKVKVDDEAGYQNQLKELAELVKIAVATDTKYIRVFSFFMGDEHKTLVNGKQENDEGYDEKFDMIVEKMKGYLKLVEGTDVMLIHENEKGIYGSEPGRVLKLYDAVSHPQFGLVHDSSNYIQCGYDALDAWIRTKDKVVYVHGKDNILGREVPMGMGEGAYQEIANDLVASGYDGFITLEPHTGFYTKLRKTLYALPLLSLALPNSIKVFRKIDKHYGVKMFESVNMTRAYTWQFEGIKNILDKAGAKYE